MSAQHILSPPIRAAYQYAVHASKWIDERCWLRLQHWQLQSIHCIAEPEVRQKMIPDIPFRLEERSARKIISFVVHVRVHSLYNARSIMPGWLNTFLPFKRSFLKHRQEKPIRGTLSSGALEKWSKAVTLRLSEDMALLDEQWLPPLLPVSSTICLSDN